MTLCRLKSDKKGGKKEWEGDREKGPRDFDKSSKNADARAWYSSFFFLSCTGCSNEKRLEYLKARILSTFCGGRSETISSDDRDGTTR